MSLGQNHAWLLPGHLRPPDGNANQNKSPTTGATASGNPNQNATATTAATSTPTTNSILPPTPTSNATASNTESSGTGASTVTPNGARNSSASGIGGADNINGARSLSAANGAGGAVNSNMAGARFLASPGSMFTSSPSRLANGAVVSGDAAQVPGSNSARQFNTSAHSEGNATITASLAPTEEDPRIALFRDRYMLTEAKINTLFSEEGKRSFLQPKQETQEIPTVEVKKEDDTVGAYGAANSSKVEGSPAEKPPTATTVAAETTTETPTITAIAEPQQPQPPRKAIRKLDDDDYDEYDEDEEDENEAASATTAAAATTTTTTITPTAATADTTTQLQQPPTETAPTNTAATPSALPTSTVPLTPTPQISAVPLPQSQTQPAQPSKESAEDVRKKLEHDKKAMEDFVKRSFHTMFFTLEDDRDAMLDQQKLEETERQIEAEMFAQGANARAHVGPNSTGPTSGSISGQSGRPGEIGSGYGPLSNVNLGSSSLALKNLIERIDMKRSEVMASDAELRNLMSEVRKNRSKWASEEKIGQEELYEPAEKVLNMLKAETTHSAPFLTRVNKREAPDYYSVITHPMDLGSMTKKLKNMIYKSKKEFVDDLNLIWANCLKYNTNPDHPLRKHAFYMRKVAEELKPMIPDVVVRDRAEVEAEERRLQMADLDGAEESDDEPIMTSRGRKAVGKGSRKGKGVGARAAATRSAVTTEEVHTPVPDAQKDDSQSQSQLQNRPPSTAPTGSDFQSEVQGSPPPGSSSLNDGLEGVELDPYGPAMSAAATNFSRPIIDFENPEYKMWKQVTQKGRAKVTAERHRLFRGGKLNMDEPALLRTKAGMRRWLKGKVVGVEDGADGLQSTSVSGSNNTSRPATTNSLAQNAPTTTGETLAENMDQDGNKVLPDYYDVMSAVPDIPEQLRWVEDSENNVVDMCEEYLTMLPRGLFVQPPSKFAKKMDANLRQMQETRKICSKVSIVKQMQVQSQMYQNQFQKYNPEPFVEKDVHPHVMNHSGPVVSPWIARAALQRSVGKIFYSVGFEEFQPSALDAVTDIAADFFQRISGTLKSYMEVPRASADDEDAPATVKSEIGDDKVAKPTATATAAGGASLDAAKLKRPRKAEDMVLHTLNAVGMDPESLEVYVKDDIERVGTKLGQLHERLKSHLAELLRPAFHDTSGDGSAMFNDGSEQFIGGDFAEDIDEDFFGFKELGLDQELGLASLTVPLHLLQNRMYMSHQAQNPTAATSTSAAFPTPPKYPLITMENVSKQIGPVHKFLLAKLKKNGERPLVEDLDLPPKQRPNPVRARLPATGKIAPMAVPVLKADNTASPAKRSAPSNLSKKDTASPSKKKAKKSNAAGKDNGDTGKKD